MRDSKAKANMSLDRHPEAPRLPIFLILKETESGEVFLPSAYIVRINYFKKKSRTSALWKMEIHIVSAISLMQYN